MEEKTTSEGASTSISYTILSVGQYILSQYFVSNIAKEWQTDVSPKYLVSVFSYLF